MFGGGGAKFLPPGGTPLSPRKKNPAVSRTFYAEKKNWMDQNISIDIMCTIWKAIFASLLQVKGPSCVYILSNCQNGWAFLVFTSLVKPTILFAKIWMQDLEFSSGKKKRKKETFVLVFESPGLYRSIMQSRTSAATPVSPRIA